MLVRFLTRTFSTLQPPLSFACMIAMAILDSSEKQLTVSEIYDWMRKNFLFYTTVHAGTAWKNSVRHNLSLNKHFQKQARVCVCVGVGVDVCVCV